MVVLLGGEFIGVLFVRASEVRWTRLEWSYGRQVVCNLLSGTGIYMRICSVIFLSFVFRLV